jgi:two-component system cell cycle sensor histidine kinase/response regulator CckA
MMGFFFHRKALQREEPVVAPATPRRRELLLVAEDEPVVRSYLATTLREDGYRVIEAADGAEALQICQTTQAGEIDLLVADIVMPKMNGKEVAYHLRKLSPRTKVIFCSGYPEKLAASNGMIDPSIPFVQKPVQGHVLTAKVREVLDLPDAD